MFAPVTKASRILIMAHAQQRAKQRARLFLRPDELADIETFLRVDFCTNAHLDMSYVFVPFYKTKLEIMHGPGSFIADSQMFRYMGSYDPQTNVTRIKSVIFIKELERRADKYRNK